MRQVEKIHSELTEAESEKCYTRLSDNVTLLRVIVISDSKNWRKIMKNIRYNMVGEGQSKIIVVQVVPDFGKLSDEEQENFRCKISKVFETQGVEGQILLYWVEDQQCSLYGEEQITQMYNGDSRPSYPANEFARMTSYYLESEDGDILRYIWFSRRIR